MKPGAATRTRAARPEGVRSARSRTQPPRRLRPSRGFRGSRGRWPAARLTAGPRMVASEREFGLTREPVLCTSCSNKKEGEGRRERETGRGEGVCGFLKQKSILKADSTSHFFKWRTRHQTGPVLRDRKGQPFRPRRFRPRAKQHSDEETKARGVYGKGGGQLPPQEEDSVTR